MAMNIPDENRQRFIDLIKDELRLRGWTQLKLAEEMGVSPNLISVLLRAGPIEGFRAKDMFKMVEVLGLDIIEVANILGYNIPDASNAPVPLTPAMRKLATLSPEQQDWLMGVVDVLLRGLR